MLPSITVGSWFVPALGLMYKATHHDLERTDVRPTGPQLNKIPRISWRSSATAWRLVSLLTCAQYLWATIAAPTQAAMAEGPLLSLQLLAYFNGDPAVVTYLHT